jgi:hypothetical protein
MRSSMAFALVAATVFHNHIQDNKSRQSTNDCESFHTPHAPHTPHTLHTPANTAVSLALGKQVTVPGDAGPCSILFDFPLIHQHQSRQHSERPLVALVPPTTDCRPASATASVPAFVPPASPDASGLFALFNELGTPVWFALGMGTGELVASCVWAGGRGVVGDIIDVCGLAARCHCSRSKFLLSYNSKNENKNKLGIRHGYECSHDWLHIKY